MAAGVDGSWSTIASWEGPNVKEGTVIEFEPHVSREWKLLITDTHGGKPGCCVNRCRFYGRAVGKVTRLSGVEEQSMSDIVHSTVLAEASKP